MKISILIMLKFLGYPIVCVLHIPSIKWARIKPMLLRHFHLALMYVRTNLAYNMQKCWPECLSRF